MAFSHHPYTYKHDAAQAQIFDSGETHYRTRFSEITHKKDRVKRLLIHFAELETFVAPLQKN